MLKVSFQGVVKRFKETVAVDHLHLDIEKGEFFTILGPSGCGKTTVLRLAAGFYAPDEGTIYFGDEMVNDLPPDRRDTAMVFQNYALFPHMKVFGNVAYGLRVRRMSAGEVRLKVNAVMELLGIAGLEERYPSALSGGQQQRVALARAIVVEPRVLLLDEPLSNLDAKLRVSTRNEIVALQKRLGITTIYVTHDQEEALSISDRIAIMFAGTNVQTGTASEIYEEPKNRAVADFVGDTNFIPCTILAADKEPGKLLLSTRTGRAVEAPYHYLGWPSDPTAMIRPERVKIHRNQLHGPNILKGKMLRRIYLGGKVRYQFDCEDAEGGVISVDIQDSSADVLAEGENAGLYLSPESIRLLKRTPSTY